MKKQKIILLSILFLFYNSSYAQWIQQPGPVTYGVQFVTFLNSNTGYIQPKYDSLLIRTTDGGNNWINTYSSYISYGTQILNDSTLIRRTIPNRFVKTTNSGTNWNLIFTAPTDYSFNDFYFVNETTGWFVGYINNEFIAKVWRTTNGGQSFEMQFSENTVHVFTKVNFRYNPETGKYQGFAMLSAPFGVITTNSGETWSNFIPFPGANTSDKIKFSDLNTGYINSSNSTRLSKTTNGGWNWTYMDLPRNLYDGYYQIKDFCVINHDSLIYCCGATQNIWGGILWKTTNGGNNWKIQVIDSAAHADYAWAIDFINTNTGWAILNAGKSYKTTNGGGNSFVLTDIKQISPYTPDKFQLRQSYPNPFNPSSKINYEIKSAGFVSLKVFDLLGKEVAVLVNEKQNAGSYAVDFNSGEFNLPSGIYFYTLNAGEFKETKKMVLVK